MANLLKTAIATSAGMVAGGNTGGMVASQGDRFNRQLHQNEAVWLTAKRKAVGAEKGGRYDAAACYLVKCAEGVPESDPNYAKLADLQTQGGTYSAELKELRSLTAQGLFTYDGLDVFNDILLSHDEAVKRSGGVIKLASGSLGAVGGLGLTSAGAAGCAPSAGATCLLVPVGGALVAVSYEEAKDGTGQALGSYRSTEGSRVLASFDAASYPGERNRAVELGVDAATATALTAAGKLGGSYLEKTWSQLKGWVGGVVAREAKGVELSFGANGRKLDFLFNRGINQSNSYNALRAEGNANRIGIADTPANRDEVISLMNEAYNNPATIVGPGKFPGSNVREFYLPGVTGTGSKIQFIELNGKVITIMAK